jgi:3-methylcrotonyl-CoA carboxylase beta subunit
MDLEFNKNEDQLKQLCYRLRENLKRVYLGGGEKRIDAEHAKGKLTARERIKRLLDPNTRHLEIGAFAAQDMYTEYGGCPSAGVVVVLGYVSDRLCVVVANDATVKAGAWFPMTAKKNLRAQEIALENHLPIIYLVDSAGVFLPLQAEVFPDKEDFGRIFFNNAQLSARGIPQLAAIMGSCVAGGAYLPILSDETLIVEGTGSVFLAGAYLVKAAIGEDVDNETLGGAHTHAAISGVVDYTCANDEECLEKIRALVSDLAVPVYTGFPYSEAKAPALPEEELHGHFPSDRTKPYEAMEIINRLVDADSFMPYKELYGQTLICGYARIEGWSVGIVANQRTTVKSGRKEMQMGGVIYSDSADKAARFIMVCNQKKIPLVFLQDVSGFMVGSRSEHGGIIKDGAKMVNAMSNAVVPKFTILLGNSYGAGNYAMCGKAFGPRLIAAWPTARMGVMSGASAAKTLLQIKVASAKAKGEEVGEEKEKQWYQDIEADYNTQLSPYYAAARLWVDALIDPLETRKWIAMGIEAANHQGPLAAYKTGVLQT